MSKSLGNGIDPLEVIDNYGADALRFMLMTGISPGNDTALITTGWNQAVILQTSCGMLQDLSS